MARVLAHYRARFLPGLDDSEWRRVRRHETCLELLFEPRRQPARLREDDGWRRVVLLASQSLRVDPGDLEVRQLWIEAARPLGRSGESARSIAEMKAHDPAPID